MPEWSKMNKTKKPQPIVSTAPVSVPAPIRRVFLIGNRGHIATDLAPLFEGVEVVGFDKEDGRDTAHLGQLIADMPQGVDAVFHLANIPHPGAAWDTMYAVNVAGTKNVITAAQEKKAKSILFFSSLAAVGFDAPTGETGDKFFAVADDVLAKGLPHEYPVGDPPWHEDAPTLPLCGKTDTAIEPYGCSKVAQEKMLLACGIPTMILRLGPYCMHDISAEEKTCYADAASRRVTQAVISRVLARGIEPGVFHVCRVGMWGGDKIKKWLEK